MSDPKVDLLRRGFAAFERGDLDAAMEMLDPEIVAYDPPEVPDSSVHRGREAVRRDWEQTFELFDAFSIELVRYFDAGDELVVFMRYRGRARGSDAELEAPMAHIWTFRDGRVCALRQYLDLAQALDAVGLSEDDAETF